jgi:hypothetical protein
MAMCPCAHVISLFAKINLTSDHKIKECPRISLRIGLILYPETLTMTIDKTVINTLLVTIIFCETAFTPTYLELVMSIYS